MAKLWSTRPDVPASHRNLRSRCALGKRSVRTAWWWALMMTSRCTASSKSWSAGKVPPAAGRRWSGGRGGTPCLEIPGRRTGFLTRTSRATSGASHRLRRAAQPRAPSTPWRVGPRRRWRAAPCLVQRAPPPGRRGTSPLNSPPLLTSGVRLTGGPCAPPRGPPPSSLVAPPRREVHRLVAPTPVLTLSWMRRLHPLVRRTRE